MPRARTSDPLDILLAHDAWATRQILIACKGLTREQFHRTFDIGLGSLHVTLTHIVSVMRRWTDRVAVREVRPALHVMPGWNVPSDPKDRAPDELLALLDAAESDLATVARDCRAKGLDAPLSVEWPGKDGVTKRYTFSKGAVFVHVATHNMHHRAQCSFMIRHLAIPGLRESLPDLSAVDWQAAVESPPEIV